MSVAGLNGPAGAALIGTEVAIPPPTATEADADTPRAVLPASKASDNVATVGTVRRKAQDLPCDGMQVPNRTS